MAWIESHQSLLTHRKTLRATALLRADRHKLIGHLHALWWWGIDNSADNGCLGAILDEEIAEAAGWPTRQAERFVSVLVEAGFLERDGAVLYLHGWWEYAGKLNAKRAKDRARKAEVAGNSAGIPREVAANSQAPNQPVAKATLPTNQHQPAAAARERDDGSPNIYALYENLCGTIDPGMAEKLRSAEEQYSAEWIDAAFEEARECNGKSWRYVSRILQRWEHDGREPIANSAAPADLSFFADRYERQKGATA